MTTPSPCAYCGALAENPDHISFAVPDDTMDGEVILNLPLCVACSQSWCVPPLPRPAHRVKRTEP